MSDPTRPSGVVSPGYGYRAPATRDSGGGNLADILERVLDRGVVIVGDIKVNLLDIELLTIKLRLLIASVDTARELGIDWWEHDPWLSSRDRDLVEENRRLRERLAAVEETAPERASVEDRAGGRRPVERSRERERDREREPYEPGRARRPTGREDRGD
ncbi:gas vesicle protein [Sphaerisporangium fuscum]|uniref:gas vesicle protein n=1 Tax=Sphaerisporangium fuscum TaxID=2835868 RepID=UPI001BDD1A55|nr:gas vesicle protein [Sphaerisporangium fuscum]